MNGGTTIAWIGLLATAVLGCGSSGLEPKQSVDAGAGGVGGFDGASSVPAVDANVTPGLPEFLCGGDVGAVTFQLPCHMGMAPIFSVECATNHGNVNFFAASFSNGLLDAVPPLNQPIAFKAFFSNPDAGVVSGGVAYRLSGFAGTAVFSAYSITTRAFLGRAVHADSIWTALDGTTLDCPMDNGLLWAVPGNFE